MARTQAASDRQPGAARGAAASGRAAAAEVLRLDPATGAIASRAVAMRRREALTAANRAARAFGDWSRTPPTVSRAILNRAARLIAEHEPVIRHTLQAEIGATDAWVRFNLEVARQHLEAAADLVTQLGGTVTPRADGGASFVFREPVGVCLAVAPWNAPFVLGVRAVATALACGNAVVLKASEVCPATHMLIGELMRDAGLPEGVLNIVTHAPEHAEEVLDALIAHDAVRRINFTGSTRVGRIIAQKAGLHLKRCLLELGGKSPLVVCADADLDAAADAAVFGAFTNQGQICMSTDRIVVLDAVADDFIARLCARAERLVTGDPRQPGTDLGPMVSEQVADRLTDLIEDALARGAVLRTGGQRTGCFLRPTVIDHVAPGMALYGEECFGPIAGVTRAATEDEAVSIANDTRYGLSAAVFSRDTGRALAIARRIDSGMCHINSPTLNDSPQAPVGGIKDSGYGRFGGPAALDEFTELRWVTLGTGAAAVPPGC